jgi:predicted ribosome quality control (RQC) complex YloA/Tae2 family protein
MSEISIGKNALDNWRLLEESEPQHYFFHLTHFSSPYVILKNPYNMTQQIIECAELCKAKSKYKNIPRVKVDYTPCSNVSKGEEVGEALYKSNRKVMNIIV